MTKQRDKLETVNVPEAIYQRFMTDIPAGETTVTDKLHALQPQKRGRGLSRVLKNITEQEFNDLYQYMAKYRAWMKKSNCPPQYLGNHREETLPPAICAQIVANRMEEQGVSNQVAYTPKPTTRRTNAQIEADRAAEAAENAPAVPGTPPTINKVTVPEATPSQQDAFSKDMALGQ